MQKRQDSACLHLNSRYMKFLKRPGEQFQVNLNTIHTLMEVFNQRVDADEFMTNVFSNHVILNSFNELRVRLMTSSQP